MSTYEYDLKYVKTYMSKSDCIEIKVPKGKRELFRSYVKSTARA